MSKDKTAQAAAPAAGTTPAAAPAVKPTKVVATVPLTEGQKKAQELLEKENAKAQEELKKNAAPKLEAAALAVTNAKEQLKLAVASENALLKALGIAPTPKASGGGIGVAKVGRYFFVKAIEKGAPQMKQILEIIKAKDLKGKGVSRKDILAAMPGVITTKMEPSRLLSYYTKPMVDAGLVTVTAPTAEEIAVEAAAK